MILPGVSDEDGDWYGSWVQQHAFAAAAEDGTAVALESARTLLCLDHGASAKELGLCTLRLIEGGRVPHAPGAHAAAVVRELADLRAEGLGAPRDGSCPWCGVNGVVSVPMRANWWQGRVVPAKHFGAVSYDPPRVLTCGVLCDRPGCAEGARARDAELRLDASKRRPTLSTFAWRVGLTPEQVLAAVREHDRAEGQRARRAAPSGGTDFDELVASIRAKVAAHAPNRAG